MAKYVAQVEDHLIIPALVCLPEGEKHSRERAGQAVPVGATGPFLIDTGSKRTTVIPGIIGHLNPQAGNVVRVVTALRTGTARLFWVRLDFPEAGLAAIELLQVACLALPPQLGQFQGLIGRDLLRRLESFNYEGRRGRYTVRDKPGLFGWLRRGPSLDLLDRGGSNLCPPALTAHLLITFNALKGGLRSLPNNAGRV